MYLYICIYTVYIHIHTYNASIIYIWEVTIYLLMVKNEHIWSVAKMKTYFSICFSLPFWIFFFAYIDFYAYIDLKRVFSSVLHLAQTAQNAIRIFERFARVYSIVCKFVIFICPSKLGLDAKRVNNLISSERYN